MKTEKREGYDWKLIYIEEHKDGTETKETMLVFGAMTIDEALRDGISSFMSGDEPYFIGIIRI